MIKFFAVFLTSIILCLNAAALAENEYQETNVDVSEEKILPYDYTDTTAIPVMFAVTKEVSSEKGLQEGQLLDFRVIRDVYYNEELILKKGDIVKGRIDTIVTSGMNGFPAEIMIDDFYLPGIKQSQLMGGYVKKGQNRCFWVYPLKWSLTLIPFVGSLTNFIKGGHVKLRPTDIITIYYYPNWR